MNQIAKSLKEAASGAELLEGLRLVRSLGLENEWLAQSKGEFFRVLPRDPARSLAEFAPVIGEVPIAHRGSDWLTYPYRKQTLESWIRAPGKLPLVELLEAFGGLLETLGQMAQEGRRHLGLHPGMIYLLDGSQLQVGGFEVSLPDSSYLGIRPPEQRSRFQGEQSSSIYQAGALLLAALTGEVPSSSRASLRELRPDLPAWLDRVVSMALERDPNHRYRDLATFRAALGAAKNALALQERRARGEVETQDGQSSPGNFSMGTPGGPFSPLGRRALGGVRVRSNRETVQRASQQEWEPGESAPKVQDRLGLGSHPEAIGEVWKRDEDRAGQPVYRFSWRRALLVGIPGTLGLLVGLAFFGIWVLELLGIPLFPRRPRLERGRPLVQDELLDPRADSG